MTQCSKDIRKPDPPSSIPNPVCQKAAKPAPAAELVSAMARIEASSSNTPAEGAQLAKVSAAVRTRCPSEPSIASVKELSSQGPS